jgi:YD repeat-containing protein
VQYNGRGLVTAQTQHAANASGLAVGTLPAANAADRRSTQTFDAAGRVVESTDARGVVTRNAYDAIGNLTQVLENATALYGSPAHSTRYEYDLANQRKVQTDASGLVTRFGYDKVYNLTKQTVENRFIDTLNGNLASQQDQITTWRHDLNNRVIDQFVDPDVLNLHTAWRYDSLGNRIAEISPNGFAAAAGLAGASQQQILDAHTTRTWFDAAGRAVLTVDQNGHAKSAQYDAVGNLVRSTVHASALNTAQVAALDALHAPAVAAANDDRRDDRTTDRVFDKADRLTAERSAAAREYVAGQLIDNHRAELTSVYDAVGNLIRRIDGNGNTHYQYFDGANRLAGQLDAEGWLTLYTRDAFGNAVRERLTLERPALSLSDKQSLDAATYQPQGALRVIAHAYDAGDHELRTLYPASDLFDAGAHATVPLQVLRTFDAFGSALSQSVMHRVGEVNAPAQRFEYDAAGRLATKTDARADELLHSDAAEILALRKDLGYVNADGSAKHAAQLSSADIDAIKAAQQCSYAYDAQGNLRAQTEAGRITTFVYDRANRTSAVRYPETLAVEVSDAGVVTTTHHRAAATRTYDANGNAVIETKPDGETIFYRFDRANRQVAALNDGVYAEYGYNAAGDLTLMHRYLGAATSLAAPPAQSAGDQIILIEVDALGRKVAETQLGDGTTTDDDRVVRYGYDANSNQVQTIDARGNASTVVYDGLNRLISTVNRIGGRTQAAYDAQGNVVSRLTGGYTAPALRGNLRIDRVSDSGATIEWTTDRAADASVFWGPAGSDSSSWTEVKSVSGFSSDHSVVLTGLAPQTDYDFYIVSKDAFGYQLDSKDHPSHLRTAVALGNVAVDGVRQLAEHRFEAQVHFNLPAGATNVRVLVGSGTAGAVELSNTTAFAATAANGAWSATLDYSSADALFQIEWTDADGAHRSAASALGQQADLRKLDLALESTPNGSDFDLTVSWNLADLVAAGAISHTEGANATYSVSIGIANANANQTPAYQQAALGADGRFSVTFVKLRDSARSVFLQYARTDGSLVDATAVPVPTLVNLDSRVQSLEFEFPDTNTNGATLSVRTRPAGSSAWTDVPASAIGGLSANVLGLAAGGYEYEATLTKGGQTLRKSSGGFTLREPASVNGLADATHAGAVAHSVSDAALSFENLLPLAANEAITVTLENAQGNAVAHSFTNATLDLAALNPGSYSLRVLKTRTTTTTAGTPQVTTTTTTTLNDISATILIGPLTLSDTQANALEGTRRLAAYALSATHSETLQVTASGGDTLADGSTTSRADHSWNVFDANGRRLFSNENGGVWTRTFHDAQGNITKEVRFQRRDANGAFIDTITDEQTAPGLSTLIADYNAALSAGSDHVRITTRTWDADGHQLSETEHSTAHGAVTSRWAHDRFGNKLVEVSAEGIAGLENAMRMRYDAANRVLGTDSGAFAHYDEAGTLITSGATQTFTYDARGNQSTATDARGFTTRMHYDGFNRLATRWDGRKAGVDSTLETTHTYDAFDRLVSITAHDLTGRAGVASQTTSFEWTHFDQLAGYTDAAQHIVSRKYDANGNQLEETDANGNAESFGYDAENRLTERSDRLGHASQVEWNAYGDRLSETDANRRVTRYEYGAFGQMTGMNVAFAAGYAALQGEAASTETMRQDWLGRLAETTDGFGKHMVYGYNDADEQVRISDLALGKQADSTYDALGRKTGEQLYKANALLRSQSLAYNNQGWLTGVSANAGYDLGGAAFSQQIKVEYAFDAAGNRVQVLQEDQQTRSRYTYDASGRMLQGRDDKTDTQREGHEVHVPDVLVSAIAYDGFGNRIAETRSADGASTAATYTYDALNRVVASSRGEEWHYDANGNTVMQKVRDAEDHLLETQTDYNAENRATETRSWDKDNKKTTSTNTYDALGNIVNTHIEADKSRFDEVTRRDVRYLERSKKIANSWAEGTAGLSGETRFSYDANGNLSFLDRGKKTGAAEASIAVFEYDLQGQIISRADKATALAGADVFQAFDTDPTAGQTYYDDNGFGSTFSAYQQLQAQVEGNGSGALLQSYLYANNKPVSEARGHLSVQLKTVSLLDGTASTDADGNVTGWSITVAEGDIQPGTNGQVDRNGTARLIALHHYANFSSLSESAQAKVVAYIESRLPADVHAGSSIGLSGWIVLSDNKLSDVTQITDYSVKQIGADGMPSGSIQSHVVRAGDTLQSIAQIYFGSPSYWYLIADANGLQGFEALQEGTTLTIPNKVVNAANSADTFKVYNESEIIGSTSPEIRTIKKKKKWWQKLVMVLIVVIMIVAAVVTAGAAAAAFGTVMPGVLGALGASITASVGAAFGLTAVGGALVGLSTAASLGIAALAGAAIYTGANLLTQGLAIASGLQEHFEWKQVTKAAVTGAVSGMAAGLAGPAPAADAAFSVGNMAKQVAIEAGKQMLLNDGKITNVGGLLMAAAGAGALKEMGLDKAQGAFNAYRSTVGAGLALLESKVRGKGDNAMLWVGLATGAAFDSGMLSADGPAQDNARPPGDNRAPPPGYFDKNGDLNWKVIAAQAVGTAIVTDHRGEDAALGYLGSVAGDFAVQGFAEYDRRVTEQARKDKLYGLGSDQPAEGLRVRSSGAGLRPSQGAFNDWSRQVDDGIRQTAAGLPTDSADTVVNAVPNDAPTVVEPRMRTSATVQKGDLGVEPVARRLAEANGEADNWRAYVARAVKLNNLRVNENGSPIVRVGQELNFGDSTLFSDKQLAMQNRYGGQVIAGNTAQTEYNKEQAALAFAEQQRREAGAEMSREVNRASAIAQANAQPSTSVAAPPAELSWGQRANPEAAGWTKSVIDGLDDAAVSDGGGVVTALAAVVRTPARSFMGFVQGAVGTASLLDSNVRQDASNALANVMEDPGSIKRAAVKYYDNNSWDQMLADGYVGGSNVVMGGGTSKVATGYLNKMPVLGADVGQAWRGATGALAGAFETRAGNTLPDGLAYRLDLPEHLAGPDGFTKSGQLSGTHNLDNATAALDAKGATYTLTPTSTDGISELSYRYVKPTSGKTISGSKTVYDPSVFSDKTMLDYSLKAGQEGWARHLADPSTTTFDVTHSGVNFRVYVNIDQYGNRYIGNVHPIK